MGKIGYMDIHSHLLSIVSLHLLGRPKSHSMNTFYPMLPGFHPHLPPFSSSSFEIELLMPWISWKRILYFHFVHLSLPVSNKEKKNNQVAISNCKMYKLKFQVKFVVIINSTIILTTGDGKNLRPMIIWLQKFWFYWW